MTSKDTRKPHDLAVTRTPKPLLVSEAVWTLSPPQKLPLGIPMKIAIIKKKKRAVDDGKRGCNSFTNIMKYHNTHHDINFN